MEYIVDHEAYGRIVYKENIWTGKREITVGGVDLVKEKKNIYIYDNGETKIRVALQGNFMSGAKLVIGDETISVGTTPAWYEVACSIAIFMVILVWGNSVYLCSIIPVIGGGIGGGVSGLMAVLNLQAMKSVKNIAAKLGIWLAMLIATFGICMVLALVFLNFFI